MKKKAWGLKTKHGSLINRPPTHHWEAERVLLFRTRKQAKSYLENDQYWEGRAVPVRVTYEVRETEDE